MLYKELPVPPKGNSIIFATVFLLLSYTLVKDNDFVRQRFQLNQPYWPVKPGFAIFFLGSNDYDRY
jgi:hypothetical protein